MNGALQRLWPALACPALIAVAASAPAQTFPDRPIKVILPYTAGSPNDVIARLIGPPMSSLLGQPVIVENRPGGSITIGVKAVMTAEPDGTTLLFSNSPVHFIVPYLSKTFSYDPLKDFVPIATAVSGGVMLVITPEIPATTPKEFAAYATAHPGKVNFGYGQGTLPHLVGEMFKHATGADIGNIPIRAAHR